MSWLGKKASHINESLNRTASELNAMDPSNPGYYGELQMSKEEAREGAFQLNLLMTDMQKVMNNTANTIERVHGMMGEMVRTRREIITKINPPGA